MKNKINVYFLIFEYIVLLFIVLYLLYTFSSPLLLLDSIDINTDIVQDVILNEENNLDKKNPAVPVVLTKFDRLKRRALWHWFGDSREKFSTYEEFKQHWNPSTSIKTNLKSEWKQFKKSPSNFVKQQSMLIKDRNRKYMEDFESRYTRK